MPTSTRVTDSTEASLANANPPGSRIRICLALFIVALAVAVPSFADSLGVPDLKAVWGTSPTDVWVVGILDPLANGAAGNYHFDGETWTPGKLSDELNGLVYPGEPFEILEFRTIAGNASNNVYSVIARYDDDARYLARFNGAEWVLHSHLGSHKYGASYVDPQDGDVYLGGRALSSGVSIIQKWTGGPDPHGPAGTVIEFGYSSSTYGFGVTSIRGLPENPSPAVSTEIFFETTNGMYHLFDPDGGTATGVKRPLIDGWGTYALPAVDAFPVKNETGDPSVITAGEGGVASFTWNGTTLTANGDSGVAPSFLLGDAGSTIKVSAFHSTLEGGGQGPLDNVFALQNVNDRGRILKYNFGTKTWEAIDTATVPLNDMIVFPDGTYFAVGNGGTVITNFVVGANRYVWANTVEAQGDHNFHGSTGGPTNWFVGDTMDRHPTIEESGDFVITAGNVTLVDQAVTAKSIQATGSFSLENSLTLTSGSSSFENIEIQAPLSVGGTLAVNGENNYWTAGALSGAGSVELTGTLTVDATSTTLSLGTALEVSNGGFIAIENGTLDLSSGGNIQVIEGGTFLVRDVSLVGTSAPPPFVNNGAFVKAGAGTGVVDISIFKNEPTGTFGVDEGTLSFQGAGIFAGVLDTKANAMTVFDGAEIITGGSMGESLTIQGAGPVMFTHSGLQIGFGAGTILTGSGDTGGLVIGSDADMFGNGTLRVEETGLFRYASDTSDEFEGGLVVDGNFEVQSGTLRLTGDVQSTGQFQVDAGGEMIIALQDDEKFVAEGADVTVNEGGKLKFESGSVEIRGSTESRGMGEVVVGSSAEIKLVSDFFVTVLTTDFRGAGPAGPIPMRIEGAPVTGIGEGENPATSRIDNKGYLTIAGANVGNLEINNTSSGGADDESPAVLRIEERDGVSPVFSNVSIFNIAPVPLTLGGSTGGGKIELAGQMNLNATLNNKNLVVIEEGAKVTFSGEITQVTLYTYTDLDEGVSLDGGVWELHGTLDTREGVKLIQINAGTELRLIGPDARFNKFRELSSKVFMNEGRLFLDDNVFLAPRLTDLIANPLNKFLENKRPSFYNFREIESAKPGNASQGTGTIMQSPDGILLNFTGAVIKGDPKIIGAVWNGAGEFPLPLDLPPLPDPDPPEATISPGHSPGSIEITGDFINADSGVVEIELGGLEAGFDYDQLIVGGTAAMLEGSKIRITLVDPNPDDAIDEVFIPRTGDTFAFIEAGDMEVPMGMSLSDFVEFTNLPAGVDLTPQLAVVDGKTQIMLETDSTLMPPPGPRIASHPKARSVTAGSPTTLGVSADGASDFTYQWQLNGVDIPGATGSSLTLPSTQFLHAGDYTVVVTADGVSTTSKIASLVVDEPPPSSARLVNLSTRAIASSGEGTLIIGFYIAGTGSKTLLIRGVGPELGLEPFNLPNVVSDPSIVVYSGQTAIDSNEDWDLSLAADFSAVGAFPLTSGSKDAALKVTLPPGGYTVHYVNTGQIAEGLIEIYDYSKDPGTRLANLSTRLLLGASETIIVGTYVEGDTVPLPLVIRHVGPGLGDLGVAGFHPDPRLRLFSGQTDIGFNDNWDQSLTARFAEVGAFGLQADSYDAAARVALPQGGYTVHATGTGEGVVIVELYENR